MLIIIIHNKKDRKITVMYFVNVKKKEVQLPITFYYYYFWTQNFFISSRRACKACFIVSPLFCNNTFKFCASVKLEKTCTMTSKPDIKYKWKKKCSEVEQGVEREHGLHK